MADEPRIDVTLQIPGPWQSARSLAEQLPKGYELAGEGTDLWLWLADGGRAALRIVAANPRFVELFTDGLTRDPTETEAAGLQTAVNVACLSFDAGSLRRARELVTHGRALLEAGGFGVFVDASGISHGACDWLDLAESPDDGGAFWAFVNTFGDNLNLWSHGMHLLGFRDGQMPRTGNDQKDDFQLRNFLAYSYRSGARINDGDQLGDEINPLYRVRLIDDLLIPPAHPMHNPFGRYRLEPLPQSERQSPN